jgi:hypothetical protein
MAAMALEELTNSPAPMIPPIEIMVTWRVRSDLLSLGPAFGAPGALT